ncbi:hypothetical protein [Candidatus Tisiphia endosymbiont of Sialis lutaria]|uniref:hypothetical protein n=1 Tax=Candidatus Tisiphia endosymbiont of Sialis lutaria TaxID=2029164 RepID=UPI00312C9079
MQEIDFASVSNSLEKLLKVGCHPCENDKSNFTNKFARQVMEWQLDAEKYAFELDIAAKYAAFMVYNNVENQLFSLPQKIDKDNLIDHDKVAKYRNNARIGFDYLDSTSNLDVVLNNTHYCIYCHKQEKDSCSKGLLSAICSNQKSMLGLLRDKDSMNF